MIGALKGQIFSVDEDVVLLDVGGVFYELHCSQGTLSDLSQVLGKTVLLLVYTHVREDSLQLYGFQDKSEKLLFLNLLKVSGIGPKSALHILSGARVDQISAWIELGDVKALTQLPKLGKKTAEQLVLTLRGKLILEPLSQKSNPLEKKQNTSLVSALIHLGFRQIDVEKVVSTLPPELDFEESLRQGLRELSHL